MDNPFEIILQRIDALCLEVSELKKQIAQDRDQQFSIDRRIVTTPELATILGISKGTLYKMRSEKRIPFFRAGGQCRYNLGEVMEVLNHKCK